MSATTTTAPAAQHPAPALLLAGLAAGILSGMFGVGGGILLVPIMVGFFGVAQHRAQGTSIAVIVPTALVGALIYMSNGHVHWDLAAPIAAGAIVLAVVSAHFASRIPAYQLKLIFFVLICVSAIRLFFA